MLMAHGAQERHRLAAGGAAHGGLVQLQQDDDSSAQQAAQALVAIFGRGAQIPKVPHAPKAAWQDVLQKEPEELVPLHDRDARLAALAVRPAVAHAMFVDGDDACGIQRGLLHIARHILHGFGAAAHGAVIGVPRLLPRFGWDAQIEFRFFRFSSGH